MAVELLSYNAQHAQVMATPTDTILYQSINGFSGTDTLFYSISDGNGNTSVGKITVQVIHRDPKIVVPAEIETVFNLGESGTFQVVVGNQGVTNNLVLSQPTLSGANAAFFSVSHYSSTIPRQATGSITVSFTSPNSNPGTYTATLTIPSNDVLESSVDVPIKVIVEAESVAVTWDNGGTGNSWRTAANWDGDAVPAVGDDVVIGEGFTVENGRIKLGLSSLTVGAGSTLTLSDSDSPGMIWNIDGTVIKRVIGYKGTNVFNFGQTGIVHDTHRTWGNNAVLIINTEMDLYSAPAGTAVQHDLMKWDTNLAKAFSSVTLNTVSEVNGLPLIRVGDNTLAADLNAGEYTFLIDTVGSGGYGILYKTVEDTSPRDAVEDLTIAPHSDGIHMVLIWTGQVGKTYGVKTNMDLTYGTWNFFTSNIPGTASMSIVIPAQNNQTFYRVITE